MSTTNRDGGFWPASKDRDEGCWPGEPGRPGGDCWPDPAGSGERSGGERREPGGADSPAGLGGLGGLLGRALAGWASGSGGRRIRSGS